MKITFNMQNYCLMQKIQAIHAAANQGVHIFI
jgi:hypothetical protein